MYVCVCRECKAITRNPDNSADANDPRDRRYPSKPNDAHNPYTASDPHFFDESYKSSHHHHNIITQSSQHHHTIVTLSPHHHHTIITPSSHHCHIIITLLSHYHHTIITPSSHHHHTIVTLSSHYCHIIITPSSHHHHTKGPEDALMALWWEEVSAFSKARGIPGLLFISLSAVCYLISAVFRLMPAVC
jgi:hypothetical protein